jgi:ribonuclease VapC
MSKVLDSFAVLAFINRENAAASVFNQFKKADEGRVALFMSAINAGEVYYILSKRKSQSDANKWRDEMMLALPIQIQVPTLDQILKAAQLKATYPISYADAFAAGLALQHNASLMTGDPEFRSIPHLQLDWIGAI